MDPTTTAKKARARLRVRVRLAGRKQHAKGGAGARLVRGKERKDTPACEAVETEAKEGDEGEKTPRMDVEPPKVVAVEAWAKRPCGDANTWKRT